MIIEVLEVGRPLISTLVAVGPPIVGIIDPGTADAWAISLPNTEGANRDIQICVALQLPPQFFQLNGDVLYRLVSLVRILCETTTNDALQISGQP